MAPVSKSSRPDTSGLRQIAEAPAIRAAVQTAQRAGRRVGLVPTMGALHAGHLSLVERSVAECDVTVATIFVNPAQFGPGEDYSQYPRTLPEDLQALSKAGADFVFSPETDRVYDPAHETYVEVGPTASVFEGAARPGHFRGVATVVLKLFQIVPADVAYFGQKDYQQTLVVRRMVADFDLPIEIRVCPTVRDPDGLALSSRNRYLSTQERERALSISEGLDLASRLVAQGERDATKIQQSIEQHLDGKVDVEYVALVAEGTVTPVDQLDGPTVVAIAGRVGPTRLIDNCVLDL